jgi:basic membrane protein A
VGYVYDDNNRALIPPTVRARLDSLTADIVAGRIVVPSSRPESR